MAFIKLGKQTLFANKDANDQNKQPHFRGEIEFDYDIPKGAKIGLAGWLNERGNQRSLFFAVSCKDEELKKESEPIEATIEEVSKMFGKE
tara:strand:+ start:7004 stop:7273 length:270 start_codon:yes stop_codon:yes gene_type:complete